MVMNMLAMFAQWEREAISERTREALQHLKAKGVHIGCVAYGMRRLAEIDGEGRHIIVPDAQAQEVIAKILAAHDDKRSAHTICHTLNAESIPAPRGGKWYLNVVLGILERSGQLVRRTRVRREYQPEQARAVSRRLRAEGLSLRFIAKRLEAMGLKPKCGGVWRASTVLSLLRSEVVTDKEASRQRAQQLRSEKKLSLRAIGAQLEEEGFRPARATRWHAATVSDLLS
jgi:hypothetical protein